jgi:chromosomal replication initiation ATPase DnaA
MRIDPRRTFRMIVAGSTNRDALAVARAITRTAPPNPLLIRGNTGVGKSLLLHAAANELVRQRGLLAFAALTAEDSRTRTSARSAVQACARCAPRSTAATLS